MLSEVIGSTKELTSRLNRALVRALLCVSAVVTLEVFHPLETLAAMADVQLVS